MGRFKGLGASGIVVQPSTAPLPLVTLVEQAALHRFGPEELVRGCFVLRYGADNWPDDWAALMSSEQKIDAELNRACPPR
jgi:hypothetical protein